MKRCSNTRIQTKEHHIDNMITSCPSCVSVKIYAVYNICIIRYFIRIYIFKAPAIAFYYIRNAQNDLNCNYMERVF